MITDPRAMPTRAVVMVGDVPVPIELPPPPAFPPLPISLPSPAPVIQYLSRAEHAVWDDVWGWVKGSAEKVYQIGGQVVSKAVAEAVPVVEAFVGQELKAISGFINDVYDFASAGINDAIAFATSIEGAIYADLANAWITIATIGGQVDQILTGDLASILEEIARISGSIEPRILDGLANVETWAIDNLYHPLLTDIVTTAGEIYDTIDRTAEWVTAEIESQLKVERLARIAAITGIFAEVITLAKWVEECGAPMCESIGPKTDLGKLFKALSVAEGALLLTQLANLDEAGINSLLRGLSSLAEGVVGDFETFFVGGGDTIGETLLKAGAKL